MPKEQNIPKKRACSLGIALTAIILIHRKKKKK
jgi:hypothetical protein